MLNIRWVDCRTEQWRKVFDELRARLSLRGDIVTPESQEKTVKIFGEPLTPAQVVERICHDIRTRGIEAAIEYTRKIDAVELTPETVRVPVDRIKAAHEQADPAFLQCIRRIRSNIEEFQRAILHHDVRVTRPGGYLLERYLPLTRVGVCVPGGAAAYPSTVLMTVIPALVAGVREIAVIAPPTRFGAFNPDILATCAELGVWEVYSLGGAQGVAALAYGTEVTPRVDKIVGPGNLFVALAKKYVFGEVDIDSIAGPSEVAIIVDDTANPTFIAFDLIAQSEHSPGVSVLIGWDEDVLRRIVMTVEECLEKVDRGPLARRCLEDFGAVVLVKDQDQACQVADELAVEHLQISTRNAEALAQRIPHAGAIFLGHYTPVALGDYAAGPSHVLPTGGTARFASALSANDFLRATSILYFDQSGLEHLADDVAYLATKEGLTAHRESVAVRRG
ncbi:MAG TPA: histidinol dehydrogenase [Thermogutta sp.]|nr:histidinol dehydrogenase [Thermogutta sp.]